MPLSFNIEGSEGYDQKIIDEVNANKAKGVAGKNNKYYSSNTNAVQYGGIDAAGNKVDFGESQYDTPDITINELKLGELNETRAQRQSAFDKAGNAVPRFVGRVATSAAELGGNIYGLGKYAIELQLEPMEKQKYLQEHGTLEGYKGTTWTTIFDNEVTRALDSLDKTVKEAFPQYESKAYKDAPWYKKWQYANFYASDLVDAAAFATGSALSGAAASKIISPIFKLATAGDMAVVDAAMAEVKAGKITLDQAVKTISKQADKIKLANFGEKFINMTIAGTAESGQEARSIGDDFVKEMTDKLTLDPRTGEKVRDLTPEEQAKISKLKDEAEGTGFLLNMLVTGPTNLAIQDAFFKKLKGLKSDKALIDEVEGSIKPNLKYSEGTYTPKKSNRFLSIAKGTTGVFAKNSQEALQEMYQTGVQHGVDDYYQAKFDGKEGFDQMLKSTMAGFDAAFSDEGMLSGLLGFLTPGVSNTLLTKGTNIKEALSKFNEQERADLAYAALLNRYSSNKAFAAAYEAGSRHEMFQNQLDNAIENADDFSAKNAMHSIMTNLVLSRIDAGRVEDLKKDLEYFKTLNKEDFKEAFGVDLNEETREHVASFVEEKLNKVREIQKTRNDVKAVFSSISPANQTRLIHATLAAKDSDNRAHDLSKEVTDIVIANKYTLMNPAQLAIISQPYNSFFEHNKDTFKEEIKNSSISPLDKETIFRKLEDIDKLSSRAANYVKIYEELTKPSVQEAMDAADATKEQELKDKPVKDAVKTAEEKKVKEESSEFTYQGKPVVYAWTDGKGIKQYKYFLKPGRATYVTEDQLDQNNKKIKTVEEVVNDIKANETPATVNIPLGTTDAQVEEVQETPKIKKFLNKNVFNRFDTSKLSEKGEHFINTLDLSNKDVLNDLIIKVTPKIYNAPDNSLNQTHEIELSYKGTMLGFLMNPDALTGVDNTNQIDAQFISEQKENNRKLFSYLINQKENTFKVSDLVDKGFFTLTTSGGTINHFKGDVKDRPFIAQHSEIIKKTEDGKLLIYDTKQHGFVGIEGTIEEHLPGTAEPSENIADRYVVAIAQANGKTQWIAAQPGTMDESKYSEMITKLKKQSTKAAKANPDTNKITDKTINDEFNSLFNDNFFITIPDELRDIVRFIKINVGVTGGIRLDIRPQGAARSKYITINNGILQTINTPDDFFEALNVNIGKKLNGYQLNRSSFRNSVSEKSNAQAANALQMNLDVKQPFFKNKVVINFSKSTIPEVKTAEKKKNYAESDIDGILGSPKKAVTTTKKVEAPKTENSQEILDQLAKLNKELDTASNDVHMLSIMDEIDRLRGKLAKIGPPTLKLSDTSPDELIDIEEATNWVRERLPNFIDVKDLNNIIDNIVNKDATWGAFKDGLIYLSKEAGKGTEYHEAFHAVFRTLLSNKDIDRYLRLAQLERGKPTTKQIDNARIKYGLTDQTGEQISDLLLEEYMADKFMEWQKDRRAKQLPGLRGLFQKIWDWIQFTLLHPDSMEALFYNIEKGSFKNKQLQFNRYNNANYAYMLIPAGRDALGNSINLNAADTEKLIATTALKLMKLKRTEEFETKSNNEILDYILDEEALASDRANEGNIDILKKLEGAQKVKFLKQLSKENNVFSSPESRELIKYEVKKRIKIFDFTKEELEEDNQSKANEVGDRFDLNASNIGGFGTLSKAIRQLIAFTTVEEVDEFGRNITRTVDVPTVYNGLERLLANTQKTEMLGKLKNYSEFNPEVGAFYNKLKSLVNYDEINNTWDDNQIYNAFTTAFNKSKVFYIFGLIDPRNGKYQLGNANQRDVATIQVSRWASNFEFSRIDKQKAVKNLRKLNSTYLSPSEEVKRELTDEVVLKGTKDLKEAFNDLGIELSEGLIKYSILQNRKLNDNQLDYVSTFDNVQPIQSNGKSDDNLIQILNLFEKGNPYIKSEEGESEEDAITRLKNIAEANSIFDESVGSSSFQNADGETVYDKILGSYTLKRAQQYQNEQALDLSSFEAFRKGHPFLTEYDAKQLYELLKKNPLLNSQYKDLIFDKNFVINLIDGVRQASINTNKAGETFEDKNKSKSEGKTFKSMQLRDTLLMMYGLSVYNKNKSTVNEGTGKKEIVKFSQYYFKVLEASNTGYTISLPEQKLWNFGLTPLAKNTLYTFFEQEFDRMTRGYSEIAKIEEGDKSIPVIKDYHTGKQRAKEFWNFKFLSEDLKAQVQSLAAEGKPIPTDLKESIDKEIQDNFNKEYKAHINQLVDLNVIRPVVKDDKVQPDRFENSLLPSEYVKTSNKEVDLNKVGNFFLNDLVNSWSFNQLIDGDWTISRKDETDFVKRNKGANAMQATFGTGVSHGAIIKEPVIDGIKRADAQMWETLAWRIHKLKSLGKFSTAVEKVYNKILNDDELTAKDLRVLDDNEVTLISDKDVYYDGIHYFKLSSFPLTRQYTSIKVDEGTKGAYKSTINDKYYIPMPGREWEYEMQNEMEEKNIHYVMPESASKGTSKDVADLGSLKPNKYQNIYWGKQVETPSGKTQITEPTQKDGLIDSEQSEVMEPVIKERQELLAQRLNVLFQNAKNLLQDQLGDKEYTLRFIMDKFKETLENSGADVNLIEFFSTDDNGNPKYNLNLPITIGKFEQLFYAHFTKGVLSVKSPGYALILKSDNEFKVARKDGKVVNSEDLRKGAEYSSLTDLQHAVPDEDGNVYSECVLPAHFKEMYNLKPGDTLTGDILKMLGVRIPTQDKHSMISLKVVDFLPSFYGSIIIAPKEIVLLSGADFDVDKLYVRRFDHFVDKDGSIKIYGENGTDWETRWEEFLKWNLENNKDLRKSKGEALFSSLRKLGLPWNLEEYKKVVESEGEQNLGVINNKILKTELKLYGNPDIREIAATPATLDELKDLLSEVGLKSKVKDFSINSINGKLAAKSDNDTGKENIGPSAISNMIFNLLAKNKIKVAKGLGIEINDVVYDKFEYVNSENKRVNHLISTILSAMTDNAKERLASAFNLTPETLSPALYMVALGVPLKQVMQITTSPIMQEYTKKIASLKAGVKTGIEDNLSDKKIQNELLREWSDKLKEEEKNYDSKLNFLDLANAYTGHAVSNLKAFKKFIEVKEQAQYFTKINAFIQLNKGFDPTVSENNKVNNVYRELGLNLSDEQFEKSGIPIDIRPLFKTKNQISKQYEIYDEVHNDIAKEFFITRAKVFDYIKDVIVSNIKRGKVNSEDLLAQLDRNLLSYLTINGYRNYLLKNINKEENAKRVLDTLSVNVVFGDLVDRVKQLKSTDKDNTLLKYLTIEKSSDNKSLSFDIIASNNRVKLHPIVLEQILNGFNELYSNEETKQTAIDLFNYLVIKDGMQFKNRSISRFITPFMYRMVSNSLYEVNDFVKKSTTEDREFIDIFGKGKVQFIEDFIKTTFQYEPNSFDYVPYAGRAVDKNIMDIKDGKLQVDLFKGYENIKGESAQDLLEKINSTENNKKRLEKNKKAFAENNAFDIELEDGKYKVTFPIYIKIKDRVFRLTKLGKNDIVNAVDALNRDNKAIDTRAEYTPIELFGDKNYNPFGSSIEENRIVNDVIKEHKAKKIASKASKTDSFLEFEKRFEDYELPIEQFPTRETILSSEPFENDIDRFLNTQEPTTMNEEQVDSFIASVEKNQPNKLQNTEKSDILDKDRIEEIRTDISLLMVDKETKSSLLKELKDAKTNEDLGNIIKKICNL